MVFGALSLCPFVELAAAAEQLGSDPFAPLLLSVFASGRYPTRNGKSILWRGGSRAQKTDKSLDFPRGVTPVLEKSQSILSSTRKTELGHVTVGSDPWSDLGPGEFLPGDFKGRAPAKVARGRNAGGAQ